MAVAFVRSPPERAVKFEQGSSLDAVTGIGRCGAALGIGSGYHGPRRRPEGGIDGEDGDEPQAVIGRRDKAGADSGRHLWRFHMDLGLFLYTEGVSARTP